MVTIDHLVWRASAHCFSDESQTERGARVRCPTCEAKPGEKCELSTGLPRTEPHRDRRLVCGRRKMTDCEDSQATAGCSTVEFRRSKAMFITAPAEAVSSAVGVEIWSNPIPAGRDSVEARTSSGVASQLPKYALDLRICIRFQNRYRRGEKLN
jgi:hypothetical protein